MANSSGGSPVWKFLWGCRDIITNHISWKLGNGLKADFWRDSWNGYPVLSESFGDRTWLVNVIGNKGTQVVNYAYRTKAGWHSMAEWIYQEDFGISEEDKILLMDMLSPRHIWLSMDEDVVIWTAAKSGQYSAKLGYQIQTACHISPPWPARLCWDKRLLPKAGAFLWTALHKRILIGDRLASFGFYGPSQCPLCYNASKSVNHLLLNCAFAARCWDWLVNSLGWSSPRQSDLVDFLYSWPMGNSKSVWATVWIFAPSMVVWYLWKERNRRIFSDSSLPVETVMRRIEDGICEVVNSFKCRPKDVRFTSWDNQLQKTWINLKPPNIGLNEKRKLRLDARWIPPREDCFKLNFDGASKGNPGEAGIGCIIRDWHGRCIWALASKIGFASNNEAEFAALARSLELSIEKGYRVLEIEGDSLICINAGSKNMTQCWKLEGVLTHIRELLGKLEVFTIEHVYREANAAADFLANLGVSLGWDPSEVVFDSDSLPEDLLVCIHSDKRK